MQLERGFTLIELMIALVIGLIIMSAVFTVFDSVQATNRATTALHQQQETLRYAAYTVDRLAASSTHIQLTNTALSTTLPAGVANCLGQQLTAQQINVIGLTDNRLTCTVDAVVWPLTAANISTLTFTTVQPSTVSTEIEIGSTTTAFWSTSRFIASTEQL